MPSGDSGRIWPWILATAFAAAAGVLAGATIVRPSAPSGASSDSADDATREQLALAVRDLSVAIERLQDRLESPQAPALPVERRPASPDAPTDRSEALERLTAAMQELRLALSRSSASAAPLRVPPAPPDPGAIEALARRPAGEVFREHMLWTMQQVLDRYGPPDAVWGTQDGIQLRYKFGETGVFAFRFVEGICVGANPYPFGRRR